MFAGKRTSIMQIKPPAKLFSSKKYHKLSLVLFNIFQNIAGVVDKTRYARYVLPVALLLIYGII
jgi:hypothetical protein